MKKTIIALSVLTTLSMSAFAANDMELSAIKSATAPVLDGKVDSVWKSAPVTKIVVDEMPYKPANGYTGMKSVEVSLSALYDDKNVYILMQYKDPTLSLNRFPWTKQADGTWKFTHNRDQVGQENTYYEDKVSIAWNINSKAFAKKGCDASCHLNEKGMVDGVTEVSAGRHYTNPGETVDLWHWKGQRTGLANFTDDGYIDSTRGSGSWGRKVDAGKGGYYDNKNAENTMPAWMSDSTVKHFSSAVRDENKVPFDNSKFKTGDTVLSVVSKAVEGSRGDVPTFAIWKDGVWTLEFKRALVTSAPKDAEQDVQFSDLSKPYLFGVTVFDNSQIAHLFHKKPATLRFK
jgi:hypothetical protein